MKEKEKKPTEEDIRQQQTRLRQAQQTKAKQTLGTIGEVFQQFQTNDHDEKSSWNIFGLS